MVILLSMLMMMSAGFAVEFVAIAALAYRICFDFNQHLRIDQRLHLGGGREGGNEFVVGATEFLPLRDVGNEHAGAHRAAEV